MMTQLPFPIGVVHFVGIGGIGMSGIAEIMHSLGYKVQRQRPGRQRQRQAAARHRHPDRDRPPRREPRPMPSVIVVSSAVKPDNPEVVAARSRADAGRAPRRDAGRADAAEMVDRHRRHARQDHDHHAWSPRCSTPAAAIRPSSIGGIINAYGTNARLGTGDWMVVEADEIRRHLPEAAGDDRASSPTWIPSISTTTARSRR